MSKLVKYSATERDATPARVWIDMTPDRADSMARHFVCGSQRNEKSGDIEPVTGAWGARFRDHPWCIESERDGWARDLRQCCILGVKQRLLAGLKIDQISVGDVMPDKGLIDHWAAQAARARDAKAWREANPGHRALGGFGRTTTLADSLNAVPRPIQGSGN